MRLKGTSVYSSINLSENLAVAKEVQVLRIGTFNHPKYGKFEITTQTLSEMLNNFKNNIRGIDIAFDYYHDSDKEASAWVNNLELRENGTELWAIVDWTPKAEKKLAERELRYFSPDFAFQWTDPETNKAYSNVLFGGGLTNRPFVKEMKAIVADELKGEENMTELEKALAKLKEVEATNAKLSEEKCAMEQKMSDMIPKPAEGEESDEVKALKVQIAELQAQLDKAMKENEVNMAEKKKAMEAQKLAEKENEFNVLLSEGKACAAQKDAFVKGDMSEFIKLAQPLNLKGSGSSNSKDEIVDAEAILKLAEVKQKENPKLQRHDAISIAKKELAKQ